MLGVPGNPRGAQKFRKVPNFFKNRFAGDWNYSPEHWGVSSETAKAKWISIVFAARSKKWQH